MVLDFTHDVLRSPAALARILAAARPGARVAVVGMKYPPWWLAPLRPVVSAQARPEPAPLWPGEYGLALQSESA